MNAVLSEAIHERPRYKIRHHLLQTGRSGWVCNVIMAPKYWHYHRIGHYMVNVRHGFASLDYCNAIKIRIKPTPEGSGSKALPMIAPNAREGSLALMAWPGAAEVVIRSPTRIGASSAIALQHTLPTKATACRLSLSALWSRIRPGRRSPAPETTPATRRSYSWELGTRAPESSITMTVPGPQALASSTSKCSAQSAPVSLMSPVT